VWGGKEERARKRECVCACVLYGGLKAERFRRHFVTCSTSNLKGEGKVGTVLATTSTMITRRVSPEEPDHGLKIGVAHFEWLHQMADVHNFGNVRKTLADVINYYLKWLMRDCCVKDCLIAMRRDVSFCCSHPLRRGCIATEQRGRLFEWVS